MLANCKTTEFRIMPSGGEIVACSALADCS